MRRSRTLPLAGGLALCCAALLGEPPAPPLPLASTLAPPISGVVRSVQNPVAGALVVLYNVAETSLARLRTAPDGTFVMASAPVGVYDLIAYKKGFQPALVRILHQAAPRNVSSVEIQLSSSSKASALAAPSTIWELADRLPADILREIELDAGEEAANGPAPGRASGGRRMAGEVATVAGAGSGDGAVLRTSAALQGGLPNGWRYNVSGDYNSVGADADPGTTSGNSAGLALAVAPSAAERVQLTARRNSIRFGEEGPASLQSNAVSWSRGNQTGTVQSVAARYIEETNLYRASAPGTTFFPIASRTWEVQGNYARPAAETPGIAVAMTYRHREAAVGPSGVGAQGAFIASSPDADLAASTTLRLSSRAQVQGGLVGRYVAGGYGIAPRVVARYDVGNGTYLFVSGLYRVTESGIGSGTYLPRIASLEDDTAAAARRSYSVGLERVVDERTSFRIEASEEQVSEVVRAFFEGDFLTNLDSVYLLDGNTVRQYRATGRHRLSPALAATVSARYGEIDGAVAPGTAAAYGVSDSQGRFWAAKAAVEILPTRTGVALLFHGVRQSLTTASTVVANDSDKIALSVAQDLSVLGVTPFGSACKLLVAVESNSPNSSSDGGEEIAKNNRFMGGVALSF
ncbi:MAG: carboxypeptidase-like regulatory domain-containing protein [Thermoanaerobaculia bacterium]